VELLERLRNMDATSAPLAIDTRINTKTVRKNTNIDLTSWRLLLDCGTMRANETVERVDRLRLIAGFLKAGGLE
jgi:hypothetical protein